MQRPLRLGRGLDAPGMRSGVSRAGTLDHWYTAIMKSSAPYLSRRLGPLLVFKLFVASLVVGFALIYGASKLADQIPLRVLDSSFKPRAQVRLDTPPSNEKGAFELDSPPAKRLRMAVAPILSPDSSGFHYQGLADYLGRALGRTAILVPRESYAEINSLIRRRHCDLALVGAHAFVTGEREFGMEALAVPVVAGKVFSHSYVIVPHESRAATLMDLRNKRFGSSDLLSFSGWQYPVRWLKDRGEDPEMFFSEHITTGSHYRSIQAVQTRYIDAAAVDSLVYARLALEDPSVKSKTRIILRSPAYGNPPMVVHPDMDRGVKKSLLDALLTMHQREDGAAALKPLRIDRFFTPAPGFYDGMRNATALADSER